MGVWFGVLLGNFGVPLLVYLAFALPPLYFLRQRDLDETTRAVWALAVTGVPIMGAVAFAIVRPGVSSR